MEIETLHLITEPTKFEILQLLMQHHYCVRALSRRLGISEPAVSQHLGALRRCGIVSGTRIGYQMHYQVDTKRVEQAVNGLLACIGERAALPDIGADCSCEYAADCVRYRHDKKESLC